MQRNGPQRDRNPRGAAERGAAQPMAGQPRADSDENELEEPESTPSFLTARELQAREPAKTPEDDEAGERHASASFTDSDGEPTIDDDEPPRSDRGEPGDRSERMLKKRRGKGE